MSLSSLIVKALARLDVVDFFSQVQIQAAADEEAEFLSCVGLVLLQPAVGLNNDQERLHLIFLGGRDDPLDAVPVAVDLFKIFIFREHNLLALLPEKLRGSRAQTFDQVKQCHHRCRYLSPLQLRNKSLGQLRAVRKLLLRESVEIPQVFDSLADIAVDIRSIH